MGMDMFTGAETLDTFPERGGTVNGKLDPGSMDSQAAEWRNAFAAGEAVDGSDPVIPTEEMLPHVTGEESNG
jgi:hypothetical protein